MTMNPKLKTLIEKLFGVNKKACLIDTEYNNIKSWNATSCWCAVLTDLQTGQTFKFYPKSIFTKDHEGFKDELKKKLEEYDVFVGHNWWGAEHYILKNLIGFDSTKKHVIDTLVLSRLLRPAAPPVNKHKEFFRRGWDTRLGGHSLEAWGNRLGFRKIKFDQFDKFSEEMLTYCVRDVDVNVKILEVLAKEFLEFQFTAESYMIECEAHRLLTQQTMYGFTLHVDRAKALVKETESLKDQYTAEIRKVFPPIRKDIRVLTPRINKSTGKMHGTDKNTLLNNLHEENPDGTFTIYEMVEFNPSSPQQVGERLQSLGWKPRKFTPTGQAATSKDVIGEAIEVLAEKNPEVEVLRKFNIVTDRYQKASKWLELAKETGRVHGRVNHIGPWTHRSSHFDDNMGNIAKVKLDANGTPLRGYEGNYGWDCRHCWIPQKGWDLVGADASGVQLRALAHYVDDPEYTHEVISGDIHVANQKAAGIKDRPTAKTFIYAWLLGAGDEKIGTIVEADPSEFQELFDQAKEINKFNFFRKELPEKQQQGKHNLMWWIVDRLTADKRPVHKDVCARIIKGHLTKQAFLDNLPALKKFRLQVIPEAARQGYMVGLDGRRIWIPSEHLAMAAYLQGFEAVLMKKAMIIYHQKLEAKGIPFRQVAYVHDEFQIECPPEHTETVGKAVVEALEEAGELLGSRCPITGEYDIGKSWAETH